jgi:hypothetical protein
MSSTIPDAFIALDDEAKAEAEELKVGTGGAVVILELVLIGFELDRDPSLSTLSVSDLKITKKK